MTSASSAHDTPLCHNHVRHKRASGITGTDVNHHSVNHIARSPCRAIRRPGTSIVCPSLLSAIDKVWEAFSSFSAILHALDAARLPWATASPFATPLATLLHLFANKAAKPGYRDLLATMAYIAAVL